MEKGEDVFEERRRVRGCGSQRGRRSLRPIERAAGGLGPRLADLSSGKEIPDRVRELRFGIAGRHHAADLVAVVDPAGVANLLVAVHEHHLGRDRRVEGLGQREGGVEIDRKRDAERRAVGLDLRRIVAFADHAHDTDAVSGESGGKLAEHGRTVLRERTGRMKKREADGLAIAEKIVEWDPRAVGSGHDQSFRRDRPAVRPRINCCRRGGIGRQAHRHPEADEEPRHDDGGNDPHPAECTKERASFSGFLLNTCR